MNKLKINDLDFCEPANNSHVQGGFSYLKNTNGSVVSYVSYSRVYDLGILDSLNNFDSFDESLFKELSEQDLEQQGKLGYRIESEDGKKFIFGIIGKKGDINFARVTAHVKS